MQRIVLGAVTGTALAATMDGAAGDGAGAGAGEDTAIPDGPATAAATIVETAEPTPESALPGPPSPGR
jgi:hypothetical protein